MPKKLISHFENNINEKTIFLNLKFRDGFYANKLLKRLVDLESFRAGQSFPFFIFIKKSEVKKEECKKITFVFFVEFFCC